MADRERGKRRGTNPDRGGRERKPDVGGGAASGRRKGKRQVAQGHLPLERANLILFAIALGVIVLGYGVLARGSITLAPILLVLGYCVLVPIAIVYRPRSRAEPLGAGGGRAGPGAGSGSGGE